MYSHELYAMRQVIPSSRPFSISQTKNNMVFSSQSEMTNLSKTGQFFGTGPTVTGKTGF